MNWTEAVAAMKGGNQVQRASEQGSKPLSENSGVPIYKCGEEPCLLAHAWSADDRPVTVFRGANSGVLFVPDFEHRDAIDWVCV